MKDDIEARELIESIESHFEKTDTSIEKELQIFIEKLNIVKSETDSYTEKEQIDELVYRLENIMGDIRGYEGYAKSNDPLLTYRVAVAAVITWFSSQGYDLSAELLTYALSNTVIDSYYTPVHGSRVEASNVFWRCRNNYSVSTGSDTFTNTGGTYEKDLYYAIHKFNWYRLSNSNIRISDRYDFDDDKNYWGTIQGYAVATMAMAQSLGVINPFYVRIEHS